MKSVKYDRSLYYSYTNPQTFLFHQIFGAFEQPWKPVFNDDASVAERAGFKIHIMEGKTENIKITTPIDLLIAEAFIMGKSR